VIFLDLELLLHVAARALGGAPEVRDRGLLQSAVLRPQATAFGEAAYPDIDSKAAALVHSLARNHALVDGNKRLSHAALIAFHGMNGFQLTFTNDEAYDFIIAVATGELDDVPAIAAVLRSQRASR
jgi:death-on-curing protein